MENNKQCPVMSTKCNVIAGESQSIQKAEKWKLLSHEQQFFMLVGELGAEATPYDWFFRVSHSLLLLLLAVVLCVYITYC